MTRYDDLGAAALFRSRPFVEHDAAAMQQLHARLVG